MVEDPSMVDMRLAESVCTTQLPTYMRTKFPKRLESILYAPVDSSNSLQQLKDDQHCRLVRMYLLGAKR
jgi:hypothetical protein